MKFISKTSKIILIFAAAITLLFLVMEIDFGSTGIESSTVSVQGK